MIYRNTVLTAEDVEGICTRKIFHRWCRQGRFPGARKIGREWVVPIVAWEAAFEPQPANDHAATIEASLRRKYQCAE